MGGLLIQRLFGEGASTRVKDVGQNSLYYFDTKHMCSRVAALFSF
jgi:hypothetical protein